MKTEVNNRNMLVSAGIVVLIVTACSIVYSHCQIPCGIYDDNMRFNMMAEHVATIEKSMQMVNQIRREQEPDMNQLVRWVENKEAHADELSHITTYYFMAQRVKPAEQTDSEKYEIYLVKLTLLHRMLVTSMKAKQTTDVCVTKELTDLLRQFKKAYYEGHHDIHEH
jgi:nickel superoxide dismutase